MIEYIIEICTNLWGPPIIEFIVGMVELTGPWV